MGSPQYRAAHRQRRTATPMRSTTERGYGTKHQTERRRLEPIVRAGQAWCAQPVCLERSRWIAPGTPWHLGHNDQRTATIGPTHARCNVIDGASKGGKVMHARRHGQPAAATTRRGRVW